MSDFENIADQVENFDWDNYESPSLFRKPPSAGVYTFLRVTDEGTFRAYTYEYKGKEYVGYMFRAKIQGGDFDQALAFASINSMPALDRSGNQIMDFIKSARSPLKVQPQQLIKEAKEYEGKEDHKPYALEQVVGPFNARVDWEFSCKGCREIDRDKGTFLRGQNSPKAPKKYKGAKPTIRKNKEGKTDHVQVCPNCKQEVGANAVITSYIVPKAGNAVAGAPKPANLPPAAA